MANDPGWDAITAAFAELYGENARNLSFRSMMPPEVDPHPCKLVAAWEAPDPPHWHLVTYGLTELFAKVSSMPEQSGWGLELTMRLPRAPGDAGPPMWAVDLMRWLVQATYQTHHPFGEDHYAPLQPRPAEAPSLAGVTFAPDPSFPAPRTSPNGRFAFLQIVGVMETELAMIQRVDRGPVVARLRAIDPLLITRGDREPVVPPSEIPAGPPAAEASLTLSSMILARAFDGTQELQLSPSERALVTNLLERRFAENKPLTLASESLRVVLRPADVTRWTRGDREDDDDVLDDVLTIDLDPAARAALVAALRSADAATVALEGLPDLRLRF